MVAGLVVVARSGKPATAPSAKPTTPDLSTVPNLSSSVAQGPQGASLAQGERFFLQLADRQDPTRIAGDVTAERSVPKGERRYELTQPRAWFFLLDGRSVHVEAASGLLTVARQTAGGIGGGLESGSLVGDVVVRVFAARGDQTRPEPGVTRAIGVLRTSRLSIDWMLGQFDAPEDFELAWETIAYSGRGVLAQFDPQTRVLDSLAVATTREIVIQQGAGTGGDAPRAGGADAGAGAVGGAITSGGTSTSGGVSQGAVSTPAIEDVAQVESLYALSSTGAVRITRDQATLDAPSLRGGMRLVNGSLPTGVTNERTSAATPADGGPAVSLGAPAGSTSAPAANLPASGGAVPAAPAAPGPTRITLAGPLEVQRVLDGAAPAELARDDWWARLGEGTTGDAVIARDASRGLELRAASAMVMGTRGLMTLAASIEQPVMLRSDTAGELTAERVEADRTNQTVRVVGAGTLVGVAKADAKKAGGAPAGPAPSVRWKESAAFVFAGGAREFEQLQQARFVGEVASAADGTLVTGSQMVVDFAPHVAGSLVPARARVLGEASVADAKGNRARGDVLAVEFASDQAGQASPASFDVQGRAVAEFDGQELRAESMKGALARVSAKEATPGVAQASGATGRATELTSLIATGGSDAPASFVGKDGVRAEAHTIEAMPVERAATLRGVPGAPARVVRAVEGEGASSEFVGTGPVIAFNEARRTIVMDAGGQVSFDERAGERPVRCLQATARGPISFDEATGVATLRDSVVASMREQREQSAREARMEAAEVTVRFERVEKAEQDGVKGPAGAGTSSGSPTAGANLRATSVEASSPAGSGPVRATIQEFENLAADDQTAGHQTFGDQANRPKITYHIEAPRLSVLAASNAFEALGAGRLLATRVDSMRADTTRAGSASPSVFAGSGAGDTLVSWRDSMRYAEGERRAVARGLVRLAHRETAQSPASLLECETLTLDLLAPTGGNTGEASPGATLRQALAEGGVWGNVQGREFTAARAIFDAPASRIEAFGDASATVTVAAAANQAPLSASRIRIDTATGRAEIVDPGTIQATQPEGREATPTRPPGPR